MRSMTPNSRDRQAYLRMPNQGEIGLDSLLNVEHERGSIEFCGRRAILVHTDAMGALRRELIETLGRDIARVILTRYGFSCGQEDAKTLDQTLRERGETEFVMTGPRLHMFAGIAQVLPQRVERDPDSGYHRMFGRWVNSYEAEQHLRLYGEDQESVCWTLAGYASGFASVVFNTPMLCVEHQCQGRGHAHCEWALIPADDSGPQLQEIRKYFKPLNLHAQINLLEQRVRERTRELEISEQRYRDLVKNLPDIAFSLNRDGRLVQLNSSGRARLGVSVSDVSQLSLTDILPRHQRHRFVRFFRELSHDRRTNKQDMIFTDGNGEEFKVQLLIKPVLLHGCVVGYQGLAVDAAAQKGRERRLEEYVRELEHRDEQIYDLIGDALFTTDREGRLTLVNAAMARRIGMSPEDAIGKRFGDFVPPSAAALIQRHLQGCLNQETGSAFEVVLPGEEGLERVVEVNQEPLREGQKVIGIVGVARDITVRRELETRLAQASRLAALGEFASGIAHEINNPIGLISGYAEEMGDLLEEIDGLPELPEIELLKRGLKTIQEQAYRCKYITGNLLSFARRQRVAPEPVDLAQLVREHCAFFSEGKQQAGLRVVTDFEESLPVTHTDPQLFSQVLMNLLKNAADALGGAGRIWVSLQRDGAVLRLQVADEGPGLAADVIKQVFDPFFTTKSPGSGTGLGLSICYGIVSELQGSISCGNRSQGGAWFSVAIPLRPAQAIAEPSIEQG